MAAGYMDKGKGYLMVCECVCVCVQCRYCHIMCTCICDLMSDVTSNEITRDIR